MSSYLRAFKALSATDTLYQLIHAHILTKEMDKITKEAYQVKGQQSQHAKIPIEIFICGVKNRIIEGSLRNLIKLTTHKTGENYVSGFSILDDCLWPLLLRAVDTSLSFVTSTVNLESFQINYRACDQFIIELSSMSLSKGDGLLDMFNLTTYTEFVAMQLADK